MSSETESIFDEAKKEIGAFASAPQPVYDEREQAIIDRNLSERSGSFSDSIFGEAAGEMEVERRRQQRAYVEQAPLLVTNLTREMLSNLGDRSKVLDVYRKMTPEQRDEALRVAPGLSQQLGDDRGGVVGRTLGAIGRGISKGVSQPIMEMAGFGGTKEEIDFIRKLESSAAQEFDPSRPGDPWYESGPLQAAQMVPWMATVVGGNVLGGAAGKAGGTLLARGAAAGVPGAKTAFQAAGALGRAPTLLGGKAATTKAVFEGAGGLAGITAAAFPGQYAQEVDSLKELGMKDDWKLRLLAGGTATVAGLVEGIVPNPFAGKMTLKDGAMKAARQYLWEAAKKAPWELSEEYLQGVTSGLGEYVAQYIDENAKDKTITDAFANGWKQAKEAALPMAFLLGVPAVGGAGLSAIRARKYQLEQIRAKGFVSESDAKQAGIEGTSRRERMNNLEAEKEELDRQEVEAMKQADLEFIQQQQSGQVPPSQAQGMPQGQVNEAGELVPQVSEEQLQREFAERMAAQGGNVTTPIEEQTPASFAARMARGEPITSLEDQQYRMNNAAAIEEELQKILARGATDTVSPQPTAPAVNPFVDQQPAPPAEQQQRLTVNGTLIPKEYESLFNSDGEPLFWNFTWRFGQANGLGSRGVSALQNAVLDGNPISVEQAKDLEAIEASERKQSFEQFKKETEEQNARDLEEQRSKSRESRASADYQIITNEKGEFPAKLIRISDGSVAIFAEDFNVIEHNSAFAKNKTDEELLAYSFEPLGFTGAKKLSSSDPFADQQQPTATPPVVEQPTPSLTPEQQVESDRQFAEQKAAEQQPAPVEAPEVPVAETKPQIKKGKKPQPKEIGVNDQGQTVFEDENGVRSVLEGDIRTTEPVAMRPTRDRGVVPVVDLSKREDRFKLASEKPSTEQPKPATTEKPELTSSLEFNVGQGARPIPGMENDEANYTVLKRKPDVIPDTFKVVISGKPFGRGWLSVDGTGATGEEAYRRALENYMRKRPGELRDKTRKESIRKAIDEQGGFESNSADDVEAIRRKLYDGADTPTGTEIRSVMDEMKLEAGRKLESEQKAPEPEKPAPQGKTEGFRLLPERSRSKFEELWNANDTSIKDILDLTNKNLRAEFEARTGLTLPKTKKGTAEVVEKWHSEGRKSESERKATEPEKLAPQEKERTFPSYRDWRFKSTARNSGKIVPNKVGVKFLPDQMQSIVEWAKSQGYSVSNVTSTGINVSDQKTLGLLDIAMYGAEGVKAEASRAASERRKEESKKADEERKAKADGRESASWIASTFGDVINDANRIALSDYVEGVTDKFNGIVSANWKDGLEKIGALSEEGKIDWKKVRDAYAEGRKLAGEMPATEALSETAEVKRYPSAIKRYPEKIRDEISGKMVDTPPIYLTGKSTPETREEAKATRNLGVLVTPATAQYRTHLGDYEFFGVDNGAFSGKFDERSFYQLLNNIRELGFAEKALFAAAPDVVGDWKATLERSEPHLDRIRDAGFPVAIVLQNGATVDTIPWERIDVLFVGGDDAFKTGTLPDNPNKIDPNAEMRPIIRAARMRGVPLHYGRVNSAKRLENVHFGGFGSSVDGTFLKFGDAKSQLERIKKWLEPWGKFPLPFGEKAEAPQAPSDIVSPAAEEKPETATEVQPEGEMSVEDFVSGFVSGFTAGKQEKTKKPKEPKDVAAVEAVEPETQYSDIKQHAVGITRTIRAEKGDKMLLLEQERNRFQWSIREIGSKQDIVSGISELKRAKAIAERVFAGTFDKDADLRFVLNDTDSLSYSNQRLAGLWDGRTAESFAATLVATGYYTDGKMLVKLSEKDKDAVLKKAGTTGSGRIANVDAVIAPSKQQSSYKDNEMSVVGYRGGERMPRVVMLKNKLGDYVILDKAYHDTVMKRHPAAKIWGSSEKKNGNISKAVLYEVEGEAVAVVMPMTVEKVDKYLSAMIEGKFEATEAPSQPEAPPAKKPKSLKKEPKQGVKEGLDKAKEGARLFIEGIKDASSGTTPFANIPMNEKIARGLGMMAEGLIEAGKYKFVDFIDSVVELVGAQNARNYAKYLEAGWSKIGETDSRLDKPQSVLKLLEEEITDGQQVFAEGTRPDQEGVQRGGRDEGEPGGVATSGALEIAQPEDGEATQAAEDTRGVRGGDAGTVQQGRGEPDVNIENVDVGIATDVQGVVAPGGGEGFTKPGDGEGVNLAPKSTRPNFHLTNPDVIIGRGLKDKFERNVRALELSQELEESNRPPTQEELEILASYIGWGAFGQELFQGNWKNPKVKKDWEAENDWLREHLGEDEWRSAQESIPNAHYTDPEVVSGIWAMIEKMGFKGGRFLEPSFGIGNFAALMPRDIMSRTNFTAIELDKATARIAKILYPQINVQQKGYQESKTPNDFYDVTATNVPFGNYKIVDRMYRMPYSIHNYFFRKAIDQTKPGGLMVFVTSNMTMDGKEEAKMLRKQLSDRGDLVAAFRFPTGAFERYAKTKVVADLIIIRKRKPGEEPSPLNQEWIDVVEVDTPSGEKVSVNNYWTKHPENILGVLNYGHGTTSGRPGMIVDKTDNLDALWKKAIESVPENILNTERTASEGKERPNERKLRQNTVVHQNNELYIAKGEQLLPLKNYVNWYRAGSREDTIKKIRDEIVGLLKVRDSLEKVLDLQGKGQDAAKQREELNRDYDSFVLKYGPITTSKAIGYLKDSRDAIANAVASLESVAPNGEYEKRPIFTRTTVRQPPRVGEKLDPVDAFALARNNSVDINWDDVSKTARMPKEDVLKILQDKNLIYKTGDDIYDAADVFLSGNMARKIRQLEAAKNEGVLGLEKSISAAKAVMPEPLVYNQIQVGLGAPWITADDYSQFFADLLVEDVKNTKITKSARGWKVEFSTSANKSPAVSTHGHPDVAFSKMVAAAMNNGRVTVTYKDDKGNPYKDEAATFEANAKIDELRDKFKDWIWQSPDRIARLSQAYNEDHRSVVTPDWQKIQVPLLFEGLALQRGTDPFSLRKHQEAAVWRAIVSGKGLFAHEVGTGKTLTMASIAIESRRLRLANKPVLFAHNANSQAVYREAQEAYPGAKILYVDNLDPENKGQAMASIATEDWDLVIIPHSLVENLKMRPETLERLLREQMDQLEAAAIEAFNEDDSPFKGSMPSNLDEVDKEDLKKLKQQTAKELVKQRLALVERIRAAQADAASESTIFLEDMGIDMLLVDEAHIFKKIALATRQQVKGLNKNASKIGSSLMLLSDYIRGTQNGRGVYLFTGTPITNTLNEIYNMQRFIMPDEMQAVGVKDWDGWFNTFATSETSDELSAGGTYEEFERLTSFVNLPELRSSIGQYMDTVFASEMEEFVPRPTKEGRIEEGERVIGRPYKQVHNETLEMMPVQKRLSEDLKRRYTELRQAKGKAKYEMMRTREYMPLVINNEGVKLALDPRLMDGVNPNQIDPRDPRLKINKMILNAMDYYHSHPKATQMIFMEIGHSDWAERVVGRDNDGKVIKERVRVYNLAKEIKRRLMEEGVPESEIAIFSAMSKEKRAEAARAMNRGEVRFAIGGTETLGTGVNAQENLIAMHHLDAPWMPGSLEQRNGRGHRQGNRWNTVHEHRYLTEGPQDGRRWQVLLTKDRFISRFMHHAGDERIIDMSDVDMDEEGEGDFEATFSAAVGDPRIQQRFKLEKEIIKLEEAKDRYFRSIQDSLWEAHKQSTQDVPRLKKDIDDLASVQKTYQESKPTKDDSGKSPEPVLILDDVKGFPQAEITGSDAITKALEQIVERYGTSYIESRQKGVARRVAEYRGLGVFLFGKDLYVQKMQLEIKPSFSSLDGLLRNVPKRIQSKQGELDKKLLFIQTSNESSKLPFVRQQQLDFKKQKLKSLVAEIESNPQGSPPWFRNMAPVGTSIYIRKRKRRDGARAFEDMQSELFREQLTGEPVDQDVTYELEEHAVSGYRSDTHVLYEEGARTVAVEASKVFDEQGVKIYADIESIKEEKDRSDLDDGLRNPPDVLYQTEPDVDPTIGSKALDLGIAAKDAGIEQFDDFIAYAVRTIGIDQTRLLGGYLAMVGKVVGMQGVRPTRDVLGVPGVTREQFTQFAKQTFNMIPEEQVEAGIEMAERVVFGRQEIGFAPAGTPVPRQGLMQGDFDQTADYEFTESDYRPSVVKWAKSKWGDAVAPNGKPTWQNFVRWFDDSEVVDKDGKPLVVYHGGAKTIDDDIVRTPFFYMTENKEEAQNIYPDATLHEFYVKMSNPHRVNEHLDNFMDWREYAKELKENGDVDFAEELLDSTGEALTLMEALKASGNDGIIMPGEVDEKYKNYLAFNPSQVKSATGNVGTFDPIRPSMLMQGGVKTDTPAFKKWFGDSKVVDKDGKPLVVYHGTTASFTEFSDEEIGEAKGIDWGAGFYFSNRPDVSSTYAEGEGGNVMPVYLSIKNPAPMRLVNKLLDSPGAEMDVEYVRDELESRGYDGIVVKYPKNTFEYIAFRPEQIKSAIANVGTFDPSNPNMLYQQEAKSHLQAEQPATYRILDESEIPEKTRRVYKLMKRYKSRPGLLYPLFVKAQEGAFRKGEWYAAEVKSPRISNKDLAKRPGIHSVDLPIFAQGKPSAKKQDRVWVEVEIPDISAETQAESDNSPRLPNGMRTGITERLIGTKEAYDYKTNPNAAGANAWPIAGSMKIIRVLSDADVEAVLRDAGKEEWVASSLSGESQEDASRWNALYQQQSQGDNVKGWTKFITATRAIIGATSKADISTFIHEFAHPMRRFLLDKNVPQSKRADITDEEISMLEEKCGVKNGNWDVEAEEKFARMWEQYWFEGKSPNSVLDSLFEKISRWMRGVYQSIQQITGGQLDPEVRKLFDKLVQRGLTPEERASDTMSPGGVDSTATPKSMEWMDNLTSNRNAVALELRLIKGLPSYADPAREGFEQWLDEAVSILRRDPTYGDRLIKELSAKSRNIDKIEEAVLSIHLRHLKNLMDATSDRLFTAKDAKDSVAAAQALRETDMLVNQLEELTDVINRAGSESARALVARKIALRSDFTQGNLLRMARIANAGESLSEKQITEITELSRRIADLEGQLEKKTQEIDDLERKLAVEQSIDDEKKQTGGKVKQSTLRKKAAEKAVGLAKKLSGIFVKKPPTDTLQQTEDEQLAEEAKDVIKAYVDAGVYSFGEFMSKFKKDIGMDVPISARAAFSTVWAEMREQGDIPTPQMPERDAPELRRIARMIQRSLVEDGVTEPEEVIDGVHESLQEIIPDITKRETMDAMSGYGQFYPASKDETDRVIRDLNSQYQQMAKLDDMRQGMAPKRTGSERPEPSPEVRDLIRQVNEMKRNSKYFVTDPETQLKTIFQATRTALRNRIYDLDKALNVTGEPIPGREPKVFEGKEAIEIEGLRKRRDELMAEYKRTFPRPGLTFEQRAAIAERAVDRAIAEMERQLSTGDVSPKARTAPISTPALEAKRAKLDALREQRDAIRAMQNPKMTEEERAEKAYIANLLSRIADYEDRKRQGYFGPKPKKERRELSPQEIELSRKLIDTKDEFFRFAAEYRLANMGSVEKAWDNTKETMHLSRAIMTSMDLGHVFRQGGIASLAHPRLAFDSAREMRSAIFSQNAEFKSIDDIEKDPLYSFAMQCGLPITTNKGKIERQEEAYMGRLVRYGIGKKGTKLNKFTLWALRPVAASSRAYTVFLNSLRFRLFKYLVSNLGVDGAVTNDEGRVIAEYVGVATGRSELGKFNQVAANMSILFFAPRYAISRFQYFAMPFYLFPSTKVSGRVKKLIAMEYARHAMSVGAFLGLSVVLGSLLTDDEEEKPTVELDPRSSDWMKLKIGDTRIDPMAGLSQTMTLIGQVGFGQKKDATGDIRDLYGPNRKFGDPDLWEVGTKFVRKKLAPIPGAIVDLRVGENVIGEKETPLSVATDLFVPLSASEAIEAWKARGIVGGTALTALALLGMGGGTYGPRTAYATADKAKRDELFKKDLERIKWDSKDLAYKDFLTNAETELFNKKREQRKQALVYAASADPKRKEHASDESFKESVAERDKALDALIKSGMTFPEVRQLLIDYYKRNYGSAYEKTASGFGMKKSLTDRLRQIRLKMNRQTTLAK